jgi:hypothetical protein
MLTTREIYLIRNEFNPNFKDFHGKNNLIYEKTHHGF